MGIKILQEYIVPRVGPAPIIVEAGAHIGRDTLKMSQLWPQGHIHAFEPVPALFTQLIERTASRSNITCYPYALAKSIGTAMMHVSSGRSTATSSLLEPAEYKEEFPNTIFTQTLVPTITLDSWAQQHTISHVDFMWLDMQGGELAALQGATSLLPHVKAIYTEIALTHRYKNNPLLPEITQWLQEHGFVALFTQLIKPTWGNTLFVNATTEPLL